MGSVGEKGTFSPTLLGPASENLQINPTKGRVTGGKGLLHMNMGVSLKQHDNSKRQITHFV